MLLLKIYSKAHSLGNILQTKSHGGSRPNSFTDIFCLICKDLKRPARDGVARDVREAWSVKRQEEIDIMRAFRPWRQKPYITTKGQNTYL